MPSQRPSPGSEDNEEGRAFLQARVALFWKVIFFIAPEPLSARGLAIPAELEAVVLACLNKDPDRRPQSAAELRRRIDACAIQPWDSARALAWWREYQSELDGDAVQIAGKAMTIAVDEADR